MKSRIIALGLIAVIFCAGNLMAEEKNSVNAAANENITTADEKKEANKSVVAKEKESVNADATEKVSTEEKEDAVKFCPVCGPEEEMHGLAFSYKHKGKKHSFCSMGCLKAFKKNPEQFLKEKDSEGEGEHAHDSNEHE